MISAKIFYCLMVLIAITCVLLIFACCAVMNAPAIVPFIFLIVVIAICVAILVTGDEND